MSNVEEWEEGLVTEMLLYVNCNDVMPMQSEKEFLGNPI
jgi:hypothetical protein